jgi:hypothetical protein
MALPTGGFAHSSVGINPGLVDPRLLAPDYTAFLNGAGQGLQLVNHYGQIQDLALARDQQQRTQEAAIAAANARSNLQLQQTGADLQLLPQETVNRSQQLELQSGLTQGELARMRTSEEAKNLTLKNNLGEQQFQLETQPARQTLARGRMNLEFGKQKLDTTQQSLDAAKQDLDAITNETNQIVAQETQNFLKKNPQMTQDELQAKLLTNERIIKQQQALDQFEKDHPDFVSSGAAAQYAENKAKVAVGDATVAAGGVAPNAAVVNPGREFATRSARNLADADKILNFGSLDAIRAFQQTPDGKRIVGAILSAPSSLPYNLERENKGKDKAAVEAFRQVLATPPATPPSTTAKPGTPAQPSAGAGVLLPPAKAPVAAIPAPTPAVVPTNKIIPRKYPTLTADEAAIQPPGTLFYDVNGNLRQRH